MSVPSSLLPPRLRQDLFILLNIIAPSLASIDKDAAFLQFERILDSMLQLCTQCTSQVSHSSLIVCFFFAAHLLEIATIRTLHADLAKQHTQLQEKYTALEVKGALAILLRSCL